jgi:hypothetical protein
MSVEILAAVEQSLRPSCVCVCVCVCGVWCVVCVYSYYIKFANDAALQPRRMAVTVCTLLTDNFRFFVGLCLTEERTGRRPVDLIRCAGRLFC